MQEASAKCKSARPRQERRGVAGQAGDPAGTGEGNGRESAASASPERFRNLASAKRLPNAANSEGFGLREGAARQERKPDAGASAGDKSLAGLAARRARQEARHRAPSMPWRGRCRRFAGRITSKGCPRAGESGVGSNAGPICISSRHGCLPPGAGESESPRATPSSRHSHRWRFAANRRRFSAEMPLA